MPITAILENNATLTIDKAILFDWYQNGEYENFFYHDILTLNVSAETMGALPPDLPERLQALHCSKSGLNKIPKLPRELRTLICDDNRLQYLPDMTNCVHLEEIDASRNHLTTFPRYIPGSVITINVARNSLTSFPAEVTFGPNTSILDVSENFLVKIPACFQTIPALCQVKLEGNRFRQQVWREEQLTAAEIDVARKFGYMKLREGGAITVLRGTRVVANRDTNGFIKNVYTSAQNVHTSSIQQSTSNSVETILRHPSSGLSRRELTEEIMRGLKLPARYTTFLQEGTVHSTHGITLYTLLSHVWNIIKTHKDRLELEKILRDEIVSGDGLCFTGRFTRVVNALCGFVEGVSIGVSIKEQFQTRLVKLINDHRKTYGDTQYIQPALTDAAALLDEFEIKDETERGAWLDAVESL